MPLLFGFRVKQLYLKEFSRVWLLWEETRSVAQRFLEMTADEVLAYETRHDDAPEPG